MMYKDEFRDKNLELALHYLDHIERVHKIGT